jgi:hypothetical protein
MRQPTRSRNAEVSQALAFPKDCQWSVVSVRDRRSETVAASRMSFALLH